MRFVHFDLVCGRVGGLEIQQRQQKQIQSQGQKTIRNTKKRPTKQQDDTIQTTFLPY